MVASCVERGTGVLSHSVPGYQMSLTSEELAVTALGM